MPRDGYMFDGPSVRRIDRAVRKVLGPGDYEAPDGGPAGEYAETLFARLTTIDGNDPCQAYGWKEVRLQHDQTWAAPVGGRTGSTTEQPARPFIADLATDTTHWRRYTVGSDAGDVVLLRRAMSKQSGGSFLLEWQIVAPIDTPIRWAEVKDDIDFSIWSPDRIDCYPCPSNAGAADTGVTIEVQLPMFPFLVFNPHMPNVAQGQRIPIMQDEHGTWVCVGNYHDDAIGTVKMVTYEAASVPRGWAVCDGSNGTVDMRGRFPAGYDSGDTDYDQVGVDTGGSKTISQAAAAITFQIGTGATVSAVESPFTVDADNRPPYRCLLFIQRVR